jgi:uncharacterized OsmC-like protein
MTDSVSSYTLPANPADTQLWVESQPEGLRMGYNSRGAQVRIGKADIPGVFSPGELLKIAVAACTVGSVVRAGQAVTGEELPVLIRVAGEGNADQHRYEALSEKIELDLSAVPEAQRTELMQAIQALVEARCPLVRTVRRGIDMTVAVVDTASDTANVQELTRGAG